ncbi:MAG: 1-(5-phosphoribosyl)-5-[(5-phosphoribosylamino) methylideneamino]imidazole-4-carboxamide isomerase [Coriobacteriia bacterium]
MIIYPAIDILDGKVVRLRQGRLDAVKVYNESPLDQAKKWASLGAEWIHVVDLDGAVLGRPQNIDAIREIVAGVDVPIQVGGGIRNMETLRDLFDAGASRAVLGTTIITEPEFVLEAVAEFDDRIVAGVDAKDGKVAIEGWRKGTEYSFFEIIQELKVLGVKRLAYTDISLDGTQRGINYGAYRVLAEQLDIPVIASGGVSSLDDVRDLAAIGGNLEGVIIGTALYEERFTLPEAIEAGRAG